MAEKRSPTEKMVKEKIKAIIELYSKYNDIYTFCPMTFGYGDSGHPDRILVAGGRFLGIEAKRDANNYHFNKNRKPQPNEAMQARQAFKIQSAGGYWICVHSGNLVQLVDVLDKMCEVPWERFQDADTKALGKLTMWSAQWR